MKKKIHLIFFGIFFLAAILAEAYCLLALDGDIISTAGLGIVVLLSGYLLADAIREQIRQGSQKIKNYVEQIYSEETEKASERYTQLLNISKASYSVAKKNGIMADGRFEELLAKLNSIERSSTNSLQKITDMQKKSLEGQRNALNFEINYNKENTKQLIKAIREETEILKRNEDLLYRLLMVFEKESKPGDSVKQEAAEAALSTKQTEDAADKPIVQPLYDDPNRELTKDEIAALFETYGR